MKFIYHSYYLTVSNILPCLRTIWVLGKNWIDFGVVDIVNVYVIALHCVICIDIILLETNHLNLLAYNLGKAVSTFHKDLEYHQDSY